VTSKRSYISFYRWHLLYLLFTDGILAQVLSHFLLILFFFAQVLAQVLVAEIHNPVAARERSLSFVSWSEGSAMTHELFAYMRKGAKVCRVTCYLVVRGSMTHELFAYLRKGAKVCRVTCYLVVRGSMTHGRFGYGWL
jgi:hypothetical protein